MHTSTKNCKGIKQNLLATLKRGINVRSIDVLLTAFMQYVKSKAEYLLNHIAVYLYMPVTMISFRCLLKISRYQVCSFLLLTHAVNAIGVTGIFSR